MHGGQYKKPIPDDRIGHNERGAGDDRFAGSRHPPRSAKVGRVGKSLHVGIDFQHDTARSLGAMLFDVLADMRDVLPRLTPPNDPHTG